MPRSEGPESRHQKYFLQSRGCGKNPSSVHLKSANGIISSLRLSFVLIKKIIRT